tara:strand:- start:1527 stop:1739 length:213 start_codon:yes stop_codon:yes gene_type:complete
MPSKGIRGVRQGTKEETFLRSDNGDGKHRLGHQGASRGFLQPMMNESRFMRRLRKREVAREAKRLNRKNK